MVEAQRGLLQGTPKRRPRESGPARGMARGGRPGSTGATVRPTGDACRGGGGRDVVEGRHSCVGTLGTLGAGDDGSRRNRECNRDSARLAAVCPVHRAQTHGCLRWR